MSLLVQVIDLSYAISARQILSAVNCQFTHAERAVLVGHNGAGKSTFLDLLQGEVEPDAGRIEWQGQPVVRTVRQALPQINTGMTLEQYLTQEIVEMGYDDPITMNGFLQNCDRLLNDVPLDFETNLQHVSGGLLRLAQLIISLSIQPDVLYLDEPTNHLDIHHIIWLERQLKAFDGLLIFVSHDRQFIESVATKLYELDHGHLRQWPVIFDDYMREKARYLEEQSRQSEQLKKTLSQELKWLNRGVKARRKRNQGRVRRLDSLKHDVASQQPNTQSIDLKVHDSHRTGQKVITLDQVSFSYDNDTLIDNLSLVVGRKDRIVLAGANGCGKTTLVELMLKQLEPTEGLVTHGTNLSVAYFDQKKLALDMNQSIVDNVSGSNVVMINGHSRHISSYLADFSFSRQQLDQTVSKLSGGEKSRVLLARLLLQPSNVLVMDEPTNDLDMTTLIALEQYMNDYQGTIIIITHDRYFMNQIATKVILFRPNGGIVVDAPPVDLSNAMVKVPKKVVRSDKKLSYADQKRLSKLPSIIEKMEAKQAQIELSLADPRWYDSDNRGEEWRDLNQAYQSIRSDIADAYTEWERLEKKR